MSWMKVDCHQVEQQECVGTHESPQVPRTHGDIDRTRGDDEWTEHMKKRNNGKDQSSHDVHNSASGETTLAGDL